MEKLALTYVFCYKITCLLVGTFSIYLGYLCFVNKYLQVAGDLSLKNVGSELTLRTAAPGIFFCVLGSIVILFAIFKGLKLDISKPAEEANQKTMIADSIAKKEPS